MRRSTTKTTKINKYIVINESNQMVRTLHPTSNKIIFAQDQNTHRIQSFDSIADMNEHFSNPVVIDEISITSINSKPKAIGQSGLKILQAEATNFIKSPTQAYSEDSDKELASSLKWTALVQTSLVILALIIGYFFHPDKDKKPEEVVTIVTKKKIEIPKPKKKEITYAKVSPKKIKKQNITRKTNVKSKNAKNSTRIKRVRTKSKGQAQVGIGSQGALSALGGLSKSSHRAGVNLGQASTSRGAGRGGNQGSGGIQTSLYAKGLKSAPVGPGNNIKGAGGYGTKGHGGGQAGYGKQKLSGGYSAVYFSPITSSTDVSGGLDIDQVNEVINRNRPKIRYCYEKVLQTNPNLGGRISISFVINASGRVSSASLKSASGSARTVASCVVSQLKTFRFPKPVGGQHVKVTVPFAFSRPKQG